MTVRITLQDLPTLIGRELGPSAPVEMTQDRIDAFAACTLDEQWIHVDVAQAAASPSGTTIAHGFLTLSLLSHFMAELLVVTDAAMAINYGLDRVRFPSAVPAESLVRSTLEVCTVVPGMTYTTMTARTTFHVAGQRKPCCVADSVTRFIAKAAGAQA